MNPFADIWKNLTFNAASAGTQYVKSQNWRAILDSGDVKYRSEAAYKSVIVHVAKQLAMSTLEQELNDLLPKYKRYVRDEQLKGIREQQTKNQEVLIEDGTKPTVDFGKLKCEGGHTIIAKTKYGTPVPESLILSFEDETPITYTDVVWGEDNESYNIANNQSNSLQSAWDPRNKVEHHARSSRKKTFTTKTVFHIDLCPQVSMSSSKNVILTQVQGRDFTRKELVSGGDLTYSVNGSIVSDDLGVYPTEAVKRFVKIMQYGGIVDVNFITFGTLGVKKVIIKDWSLGNIEYKNIQPYSFSCVAVEPNDTIKLNSDTIASLNQKLSESKMDTWYKSILDNKLKEIGVQAALNIGTNAVATGVGAGLDALLPNL